MLLHALREIQERLGHLPNTELERLAEQKRVPLWRLQELTTFFPSFRRADKPIEEIQIQICRDMSCHLRGAAQLLDAARDLGPAIGDWNVSVQPVSCLGRCDRAPAGFISRHSEDAAKRVRHNLYVELSGGRPERELPFLVHAFGAGGDVPPPDGDDRSQPAPNWNICAHESASERGGVAPFSAVRKFLTNPDSGALIKLLGSAALVGMGGAQAGTAKKWCEVMEQYAEHKYVVCNADESEPGTFKDREILLRVPHLVVEGVILAGLCLKAQRGFIFIRHEYHEPIAAVQDAIAHARRLVPEAFEFFNLTVFVSPGGYICGEQSAMLEAIEDRRAQPRNAPPEIQVCGLYGRPTLVNNVETFAWVPAIVARGPDWYKHGRWRFFSISGDVNQPGVHEVTAECTLGELVELAGGPLDHCAVKAVALSGPSGGFLPRYLNTTDLLQLIQRKLPGVRKDQNPQFDELEQQVSADLSSGSTRFDVLKFKLDASLFRNMDLMLGAGIVVYVDRPGLPMLDHALNCLAFFHKESCGKCVPCRLGCERLVELGTDLRGPSVDDAALDATRGAVRELAEVMRITSICGLGRVAANPLSTILEHFRDELPMWAATAAAQFPTTTRSTGESL